MKNVILIKCYTYNVGIYKHFKLNGLNMILIGKFC